jgi:DNA repair protein RadA/Sms
MTEERAPRGGAKPARKFQAPQESAPVRLSSIASQAGVEERVGTGMGEVDRVLGGGLVAGSAVLVGGDPGIGKSTLLLQVSGALAARGRKVLYVTGEESARQLALRAARLKASSDRLYVYPETNAERIIDATSELKPDLVVVDSVQTVYTSDMESSPGTVSQVREAAGRLISATKPFDTALLLVGHVTKDGSIAGPRVLEHMVDTVLYLEGEPSHQFRILRAVKNRYGSAMEIGVFEMKEDGLEEVENPSEIFLADRPENASGSAVVSSVEGTRPILCEIQSLVSPTLFGVPRRTVVGVDYNKVLLLGAVLEKKAGIVLANHDIFIKVAGGLKLAEPAVDLGIVASMVSNHLDKPIGQGTVLFGEVGLAGEIRAVGRAGSRVAEAGRLGFKKCIMPEDNIAELKKSKQAKGMELVGVKMLSNAIDEFFK